MDKWKVSTLVLAGFVGGMVYASAGGIDANAADAPRPICEYAALKIGAQTDVEGRIAAQRIAGRQFTTLVPSGNANVLVCSW